MNKERTGCPVPCCAKPQCDSCTWRGAYLVRQQWIVAYGQSVGLGKQVFRYLHPEEQRRFLEQGPCKGCPLEEVCDLPCPGYVRWWDLRMERIRRGG